MIRADARHNYDQLLVAAQAAFAEQGTQASLRDVARRAGVGIGTLYRHFPTREALLEALFGRGLDNLSAQGETLLAAEDPAAALAEWVRELALGSARSEGLAVAVIDALHDPESALHASCQRLRNAGARLLARAQRSGRIRPDLTADELFATAAAMAWAAERTPRPEASTDRFLTLLTEGIAARPAESVDPVSRDRSPGTEVR